MIPLLVIAAAAAGWFARVPPAAARAPVVRFTVPAPAGAEFDAGSLDFPGAVLSPDGSRLVLVALVGRTPKLFVRPLDRLEATPLPGTDEASNPFFSADGRWVAFTANRKLRKVPLDGGSPLVLADAFWGGGTWTADDTIIYTPTYQQGLWRIPAGGGTATKLTEPDRTQNELGHWWPQVLPDGKHVLFTAYSTPIERSRIAVYDLGTGQIKTVAQGGTYARYLPTGHLVYARTESVVAVPFELSTLSVIGAPVPVVDDVMAESESGMVQISFANNGTMAYVPASLGDVPIQLVWVDRAGVTTPMTAAKRRFFGPELSRSGRRLAVTVTDDNTDLWVYELERDFFTRLTFGAASDFGALWDKDDRRIVFASEQPAFQVFMKPLSSSAAAEPVVAGPNDTIPTSISADGTVLLYTERHPATGDDIMKIALTPGAKPEVVVRTPFSDQQAVLSPDGRWMAYVSDDSGRDEVFVQAFPNGGERWQVSTDGGSQPRWSRDGRELYFANPGRFTAVPILPGSTFAFGKPQGLFQGNFRHIMGVGYDVAPDGKRFIMLQRDPAAPPITVSVVLNWFDELRAKVPK
jgi:serine/threonine-protein kinase